MISVLDGIVAAGKGIFNIDAPQGSVACCSNISKRLVDLSHIFSLVSVKAFRSRHDLASFAYMPSHAAESQVGRLRLPH